MINKNILQKNFRDAALRKRSYDTELAQGGEKGGRKGRHSRLNVIRTLCLRLASDLACAGWTLADSADRSGWGRPELDSPGLVLPKWPVRFEGLRCIHESD